MIRLLIIADDFTGALDTGIQFQGKHTALRFGQKPDSYLKGLTLDTQVLIVDAETRHLPLKEAGAIVGQIAADAAAAVPGAVWSWSLRKKRSAFCTGWESAPFCR